MCAIDKDITLKKEWDVIVAGGGISGSIAAIASARAGARTLLVEQYGFLGGMLTAGGVGPMMSFHAGEQLIIQGITDELIQKLKDKGKSPGHIFDTTGYTYTVTPFDAEGLKHELEIMFLEAGGELLYHTMLCGATTENGVLQSIQICNKAGISSLTAKVFVDATGDADLAYWSGVDTTYGRPEDGCTMPMTMNIKVRNVDIPGVKTYIREHLDEFPQVRKNPGIIDRSPRLSLGGFIETMKQARERGELSGVRSDLLIFETNNPGEVIVNTSRIMGYKSTEPYSLTQAEIEGRKHVRELEHFLIHHVAGFENAVVVYSGPTVGVRSSRQIKGVYTLTVDDLVECVHFDDTIAHGGYPIDVHPPKGKDDPLFQQRKKVKHLKSGEVYSIPYRSLINPKVSNLITVGRCISATFEAQGGIRVTPIAGAIGHAGGAAAALAVKTGKCANELDIVKLRDLLVMQNAYLKK